MRRRKRSGQAGFVMTMELVLIFTILGLGVLVGIVAIRNALVKFLLKKQSAEIYVVDSGDPQQIIGKAFDLDEHEAPRVQFYDQDVDFGGVTVNRRVMIGVRDDRFTTRHRIFYTNSLDCGASDVNGDPPGNDVFACITAASDEEADSVGVGKVATAFNADVGGVATDINTVSRIDFAGGQGYLYGLQAGPTYGIGADLDQTFNSLRLPGTLYRQNATDCTDPGIEVRSMWTSQSVVSGEACEALPAGIVVTAAKCPPGADSATLGSPCDPGPNVDSRCVTAGTCNGGLDNGFGCATDAECPGGTCDTGAADLQCACPFTADGNDANDWEEVGSNCCPPGSDPNSPPGQCIIDTEGVLFRADPVTRDGGANALSIYPPPFRINYPVEVDATFEATAPGGFEGAPAGPVIPGGTDVDSTDYATPPAGGESGPP